jgi:hypothetical protein
MSEVMGTYPDLKSESRNSRFTLTADQGFNPYTWKPPIHWSGLVGGKQVKFTQIMASGAVEGCYDWTGFPIEIKSAIPHIVKAIDDAMRTMD